MISNRHIEQEENGELRTTRSDSGFTMVEAVTGLLLVMVLLGALVQSVGLGRNLTYSDAQRVAAFGMCKAGLESVRAREYSEVAVTNFPDEVGLQFAHLSGKDRNPIACQRSYTITDQTAPDRKDVSVTVSWQFRGQNFQEQIDATLYNK